MSTILGFVIFAQQRISGDNVNIPTADFGGSTINAVIVAVLGIMGAIAALIITMAGFQYVTSSGDPQKIAKAKDTIIYTLVGLVIAVFATAIIGFVLSRVT